MHLLRWYVVLMVVLSVTGCAGMQTGASPATMASLAPTGKLRVAFISAPLYATKDPATGELKGVALDLGNELARRLGVPFAAMPYGAVPELLNGAKSGAWDVALMGINVERAALVDFSTPYAEVEQTYMVRGANIATAQDVDRPGVRVAVLQGGGADTVLTKSLKQAEIVRATSAPALYALFDSGKADAVAAATSSLLAESASRPGSRVLEGRFLVEPLGFGVPKGRDAAGAQYVGRFVESAKAQGVVKSAIERAGLRGVVVPGSR
jgi:polar amino acid transport system substrate-binding protein